MTTYNTTSDGKIVKLMIFCSQCSPHMIILLMISQHWFRQWLGALRYRSQCCPVTMLPYGVTWPQWIKSKTQPDIMKHKKNISIFKFKFKFKQILFKKYKIYTSTEWRLKPSRVYMSRLPYSIHITQWYTLLWQHRLVAGVGKEKTQTTSKSGCAIGNTSMNSVVHINNKIISVQSYPRFHHFECVQHIKAKTKWPPISCHFQTYFLEWNKNV